MLQYELIHGKLGTTYCYVSVRDSLCRLSIFPSSQVVRLPWGLLGGVRRLARGKFWFSVHDCNLLGPIDTYNCWLWRCYPNSTLWTPVCNCMDVYWGGFVLICDWCSNQCGWDDGCWKRTTQREDPNPKRVQKAHWLALILIHKNDTSPWE